MNELGLRIKKLRVFRGFTQEEVATKLFLSLKAYQNIEHGITKLDLERIEKLAAIFSITISELINTSEIKLHFDKARIAENDLPKTHREIRYPMDLEDCHLLLKERDNEICFLKMLLSKFSDK